MVEQKHALLLGIRCPPECRHRLHAANVREYVSLRLAYVFRAGLIDISDATRTEHDVLPMCRPYRCCVVKRHIICERDVGLFSLIQQVIANVPWAMHEQRIPIVYFQDKTCYWTAAGYHGSETVWEYYFEPLVVGHSASTIPPHVRGAISKRHPSPYEVGYFVDDDTFVSSQFGDHPELEGKTLSIPYLLDDPSPGLRQRAAIIVNRYVTPRDYVRQKVEIFAQRYFRGEYVIGVHMRGTDAISAAEIRPHRKGSLSLAAYTRVLQQLLDVRPAARVFVATDDEASLAAIRGAFGDRVVAYDSLRHRAGQLSGTGPTGWIMPAYIAGDRDRAARNGEEAVIEYLLLSRCQYLVHNGSSLARTVLLNRPDLGHINTHRRVLAPTGGSDGVYDT